MPSRWRSYFAHLQERIPGSRGPASQFLTRGNRAIFRDIFWMHIAYLFCGKKQMRALWNAGDISREVFLAWSLIDVGLVRGHDDIIWNGALGLARHEQVGVLQRVIDSSKTNQLLMRGAGLAAKDTIPGRDTPFDVLEGNFDNPDARMEWVEETLWPAFRSYESEFGVSKLVPVPPDIQADVALFPSTPK